MHLLIDLMIDLLIHLLIDSLIDLLIVHFHFRKRDELLHFRKRDELVEMAPPSRSPQIQMVVLVAQVVGIVETVAVPCHCHCQCH